MEELRSSNMEASVSGFTQAEIVKLENLREEVEEEALSEEFFQKVATSFSCARSHAKKPPIKWKQVQSWFQNKQNETNATFPHVGSKELALVTDSPISTIAPESSQMPEGERVSELSELAFEAKSSKDNAWYDVGSFLTYRVISTGELEVRVRFAGFGNEEDEWVSVKRGVRERSIPLEPSECHKVKVGDLVLCFQDRLEQAVYCDAHVVEIQRRLHDLKGCRCIFVVRYDHDNTLDKVLLKRLCCRPS